MQKVIHSINSRENKNGTDKMGDNEVCNMACSNGLFDIMLITTLCSRLKRLIIVEDKAMNRGIDYGMGNTNIDEYTGIRYGVIPIMEVLQAWCDSSEPYYPCNSCSVEEESDDCPIDCEPSSFYIDDNEYVAESTDEIDIFITKSPYYTRCQFCSPCAPGAGYVMNECEDGVETYCFGHEWFEEGKAPYKVYRVSDGELIEE